MNMFIKLTTLEKYFENFLKETLERFKGSCAVGCDIKLILNIINIFFKKLNNIDRQIKHLEIKLTDRIHIKLKIIRWIPL